jgi:hypothetical protein
MSAVLYLFFGLLAVLGRIVGQMLAARWSLRGSRRELRSSAVVDAWRRLARATGRPSADFLRALADIQLVGTPAQVELAASAARALSALPAEAPSVLELLEALRAEVRGEMGLGRAPTPLAFPRRGVDPESGLARLSVDRRHSARDVRRGRASARLAVSASAPSLRVAQARRTDPRDVDFVPPRSS